MKNKRHSKILELIQNNNINTQEELLRLLRENEYDVTQATVSRDIKELKLVKVQTDDGKYKYKYKDDIISENNAAGFLPMFSSSITKVEAAQNLVVIKSIGGMAQAICTGIDLLKIDSLIGTVAGDDTIFVALKDSKSAEYIAEKFQEMIFER